MCWMLIVCCTIVKPVSETKGQNRILADIVGDRGILSNGMHSAQSRYHW